MSVSKIRQNFHADSEQAINNQINLELTASYIYQSMGFFFDRDDIALPGFSEYFKHESKEEREHAEKFMAYLNKRGGRIVLQDVKRPSVDEWGNGLNALTVALELEKKVNQSLLDLHAVASAKNDPHLTNFIEEEFLDEAAETVKEFGDYISRLKRAGPEGLGEYIFDKDLMV